MSIAHNQNNSFQGYTDTDNDNDPNEQLVQGNLENTEQISILQINIEGLSMAKRTYLERMSKEHKVNILCLQETHIPKGALQTDLKYKDSNLHAMMITLNTEQQFIYVRTPYHIPSSHLQI
jgi:hypothetical protein